MKQLFYKLIYLPTFNFVLRNLNKLLYPLLPKQITLPPSGVITINVENKPLKLLTNQTNYLTQLVFWNGYQNFEYTPIFTDLIKNINCFFDIGANIGYYSLLAAHLNPKMTIIAFEPAAGPLHYLKENVRKNQFNNIKIEGLALSDKLGEITFYTVESEKYHFIKHNLAGERNAGSKTTERNFVKNIVTSTTLSTYIEQNQVGAIDLIKIDTEGTEHIILGNGREVLEDHKPIIICETLFDKIENQLDDLLSSYGYEFYNHVSGGLQQVETIKRNQDNGVTNCFFVHPDKKKLIEPYII